MFPRRTHPSAPIRLTSTKNPLLREIRKAVDRGSLTHDGLCVAEGFHLLAEARRSSCSVEAVIASDSAAARAGEGAITVPDEVFAAIASTETTQGVITLVRPPEYQLADMMSKPNPLLLVLDALQDPGNAGTLIRAAEAFGASGVAMTRGCVSPWNPKALRASAGSAFRVPVVTGVTPADITIPVLATLPGSGRYLEDVSLRGSTAIVIGSEARGVSSEWLASASGVTIRTAGVESLNAAMAGAIVLYEASRQRSSTA
jgi:RNA methyltransferase, TrmH family